MKKSKPSDAPVKVHTSGKLILSGEHAIVYGAPAIAMSTKRGVTTVVSLLDKPQLQIEIANYAINTMDLYSLIDTCEQIRKRYADFLAGECKINEVLTEPSELIALCFYFLQQRFADLKTMGHRIHITSDIPIGSGMGSSAAVLLGLIQALNELHQLNLTADEICNLAQELEDFQHGKSSGLDIGVIFRQGVYLVDYAQDWQPIPELPWKIYAIPTGSPESSTGECVAHAKQFFDPDMIAAFSACSMQLYQAICEGNLEQAQHAINHNHELLCAIGVVPAATQKIIAELHQAGVAAKISGAGSIAGDQAGMIICLGDELPTIAQQLKLKYFIA